MPGSPIPSTATEAARQLWAHESIEARVPEEVAAAAQRLCTRLRAVLVRWIGSDGYDLLWQRALEQTKASHPALAQVRYEDSAKGIAASLRGHDAATVADSILALVAALVGLLGRVVGEGLAVRLVAQVWSDGKPESKRRSTS